MDYPSRLIRAKEKSSDALYALVTWGATLSERIINAWTEHLHFLSDGGLPVEFQERFDAMYAQVTASEPERPGDGRIDASVRGMSDDGREVLVRSMVAFAIDVAVAAAALQL